MMSGEDRNIHLVSICRLIGVRNHMGSRQEEGEITGHKTHVSRVDFLKKFSR